MSKQYRRTCDLNSRPTFVRYVISGFLIVTGLLLVTLMLNRPRVVEAQNGGGGRLLVAAFGNFIYAANADPGAGPATYDVVSHYPSNAAPSFPSVSQANRKIAFLYQTSQILYRVWIMDGDGSNLHQLTTGGDAAIFDSNPIISPDGTKVAFRSNRFATQTFSDGSPKLPELFVINSDGTNLQQVTPSQQEPQHGSNPNTYIDDFGWSGSSLYVVGGRVVPGQQALQYGIFKYNSDGTGQTTIKITGGTGFATADAFDVSPDGSKLAYSNTSRIFIFDSSSGGLLFQLNFDVTGSNGTSRGSMRFSPDGTRILFGSSEENGCLRTINLDGTGRVTVLNNQGGGGGGIGKWWFPSSSIPTPARLELTPGAVTVPNNGTPIQITPTLYDANHNVIFHAAQFSVICDATHVCDLNANPFGAFQFDPVGQIRVSDPNNPPTGYVTVCGDSGGLRGCDIAAVNTSVTFAEIRAGVASVNTNGVGGPGVFTVRRSSTNVNTPASINFTLSGSAVRDTDYALDVAGNSFIIPSGQTTFDIKVTPLRAAGNKSVTLSITATPGATYVTVPGSDSDTVTINDNGGVPTALQLSSITPDSGGDGGTVFATIYGANIRAGANIKLSRSGQSDIIGANVRIAASGTAASVVFDLSNRTQGLWDVVVTNSDSGTAKLTNRFQIQPYLQPDLDLIIAGPNNLRANHTRARYDIVYSNNGNVDAFGVFLLVHVAIPFNKGAVCQADNGGKCTRVETPLLSYSDIPNLPPAPDWVNQVPNVLQNSAGEDVLILLPRISARSVDVVTISLSFALIPDLSSDLIGITAGLLPPAFHAVNLNNTSQGFALIPSETTSGETQSNEGALCVTGLVDSFLRCADLAGLGCGRSVLSNLSSAIVGGLSVAANPTNARAAVVAGSCFAGLLAIAGECGLKQLPAAKAFQGFLCATAILETGDACWKALKEHHIHTVASADPNEKIGVSGLTAQNYISNGRSLYYLLHFENLETATAPAQDVVITDQLDTSTVDLTTFSLSQISFGNTLITVPPGLKSYSTEVDLRPAKNLLVRVSGQLNQNTGLVTWEFHSIDPFTRQPPSDALSGFLPPNILGTEGAGNVAFAISSKTTVTAGTEIRNRARITFDVNAPLDTNEWLNTIDNSKPTSSAQLLAPEQQFIAFDVNWSGTDTGSGVKDYTLYVSENGGAYQPALVYTTDKTQLFIGKPNTTYAFYTIARDQAGNVENNKSVAEATTHTPATVLNSIDDARFFARQHYLDFLSRDPDRGGLDYWTGQITGCGTNAICVRSKRVDVSNAFFYELEFQQTGSYAYRLYRIAYGNNQPLPNSDNSNPTEANKLPSYAAFGSDRAQVIGGADLTAGQQNLAGAFVQRTEFIAKYPASLSTAALFVDAVLATIQSDIKDANGAGINLTSQRNALINVFNSAGGGNPGRAMVMYRLANDDLAGGNGGINNRALIDAEYNRTFVYTQYAGYLRRDSDIGGFLFWLGQVNRYQIRDGNAQHAMVCSFITSAEYQLRFGSIVTHSNSECAQ